MMGFGAFNNNNMTREKRRFRIYEHPFGHHVGAEHSAP
jgi:hypothetical protein